MAYLLPPSRSRQLVDVGGRRDIVRCLRPSARDPLGDELQSVNPATTSETRYRKLQEQWQFLWFCKLKEIQEQESATFFSLGDLAITSGNARSSSSKAATLSSSAEPSLISVYSRCSSTGLSGCVTVPRPMVCGVVGFSCCCASRLVRSQAIAIGNLITYEVPPLSNG